MQPVFLLTIDSRDRAVHIKRKQRSPGFKVPFHDATFSRAPPTCNRPDSSSVRVHMGAAGLLPGQTLKDPLGPAPGWSP